MSGFESAQGITFKFNNAVYTATAISASKGAGEFNVTSLNVETGGSCITVYRPGGLKTLELKVDFIGNTLPPQDDVYTLQLAGGGLGANGALYAEAASLTAACTSVQISAQAGELIKGSATFKVSVD
jgi:hypothetical protein